MKTLSIIFVLIFAAGVFGQAQKTIVDKTLLDNVKTIYVDDLGGQNKSDLIREKLIGYLNKTTRFKTVETPEEADAVLTGEASVETAGKGRIISPTTGKAASNKEFSRHGVAALKLVDAKTKNVIWTFTFKGLGKDSANNPTGKIAFQTVKRLLEDVGEDVKTQLKIPE